MVRDFAWISAANILVKPAWFVFVTAACMRVLGPAGYGVFVSAIALASVFVVLTEWGVAEYAMREISRDRSCAPDLFSNLVVVRLVSGLVSVALAVVCADALGYTNASGLTVGAAGLYALGLRVNDLCRGLYRGSDAFAQDAVLTLAERLTTIGAGTVALFWTRTPTGVLTGLAVGISLVVAGNLGWVAWRHRALSLSRLSASVVRAAYATAYPIGVFGLVTIAFHSVGPVLLATLVSDESAGHYGAAWRVIELYMLAPTLVTAVVMPRLSSMAISDGSSTFNALVMRSSWFLLLTTGALALGTGFFAEPLVALLSGAADFAETVDLLRWLSAAFPLMSLSMLLSLSLIASDRQWAAAIVIGISAVLHIGACFAAIPRWGALGVAIAMVACYLVATGLGILTLVYVRPQRTAEPQVVPS